MTKSGFTIIEIMIAIGIMIILSGISWAAFRNYQPTMELSATIRNITTDLRLAQQLSVTQQINHGIFFDILNNNYQLKKFIDPVQILFSKNLPSSITTSQITGLSDATAIFNPYGAVVASGSVYLVNLKGQTKIIEIKPSGFVKIQN